jgi:hypothetical protein
MQVSNPGGLSRGSQIRFNIPKVLIWSQLPADTTYPLDISLRVLPPPDGQQGQWTARIYLTGDSSSWQVVLAAGHPLSAYAGRSISKMSLSQDRQLTLTFAAPAGLAATAGAGLSQGALGCRNRACANTSSSGSSSSSP